jgi:hypothetical protein
MMPRAADSVLDKEAVNKWSAIMSASGAKRENLMAALDKEHRFTPGVTEHPPSGTFEISILHFAGSFDLAGHFENSAASARAAAVHAHKPFARDNA